jgi:hypothetical protein
MKVHATATHLVCNRCQRNCPLEYLLQISGSKHLMMVCPEHGRRYLPFVDGLDIPVRKSVLLEKLTAPVEPKPQLDLL